MKPQTVSIVSKRVQEIESITQLNAAMVAAKGKVSVVLFHQGMNEETDALFNLKSLQYRNTCFFKVDASEAVEIVDTHLDDVD